MKEEKRVSPHSLSIVIPCYNEEKTLAACVERVFGIEDEDLQLEVIIVNDCSIDRSQRVAEALQEAHPNIVLLSHARNQGKGAALRTGISRATGNFVAIQDADLEYSPEDLKRLVIPLIKEEADVVFGSRFLSSGCHRVLYFWHSLGNRFLTFLSNMLTDLNLTDMETCYKVFRREIIQGIRIQENRFGFEPEVVAKVAQLRVRVYEMGISYYGRTYAEGKKIRARDGWRALYCILKYNLPKAPWPIQFFFYSFVGGFCAVINLAVFLGMVKFGSDVVVAAPTAFVLAATLNYWLSIWILFRHKARWTSLGEILIFAAVVLCIGGIDLAAIQFLINLHFPPWLSKSIATALGLTLNFAGRRLLVFPEPGNPDWAPQKNLS